MVDLPRTPLDNSVTQGTQSSVSGGELRSAFGQLAQGMDELGQTFEDAAVEKAGLEGQGAVYRDDKGVLQYDSRNPLSRAGKAFNRSAQTAFVSQISMDARPAVANLEVEAKGNVGEFDKLSSAYLKEMLKGKDPLLRGAIQNELTSLITSSRTGMIRSQQQRDIQMQSDSITARIKMANEDAAALARTGGTGTAEYAKQLDIIKTLEKEKVDNPLFAYSQAESDVFLRGVEGSHMAEAIVGQVESIYQGPGGMSAAKKFAYTAFNDPSLQLSPGERAKYRTAALGALKQFDDELKLERADAREAARVLTQQLDDGAHANPEDVHATVDRLYKSGDPIGAIELKRHEERAQQKSAFGEGTNEQKLAMFERINGGSTDASLLIKQFEGFRPRPYFDVNANRVGYGSDTVTLADGTWQKVMPGMIVSRAAAERDLQRRIVEFQGAARAKVGGPQWDGLDGPTKAALTSVAYNYGSLPDRVAAAVRTGDKEKIAASVEGLDANPGRRAQEASIIRGGLGVGSDPKIYKDMQASIDESGKVLFKSMQEGFRKSEPYSQDDLNLLGRYVGMSSDTQWKDAVLKYIKGTGDYSTQNLAEMEKSMADGAKNATNIFDQEMLRDEQTVHDNTVKGLKDDAISMASKRGVIPVIEPLDMANPTGFAAGLLDRQRAVNLTQQRYGITDAAALTADEVDSATRTLATAPIEQRVQMLATMSEALTPQTYMATMAKIADKSGPVLGIAGGLYAKNPDVAESVMRGSELLKATPALVPSAGDENKALIQASLPYQAFAPGMDAARSGFLEAARARYADLSSQTGDTTGQFSQERMDQAVKDVTGGLVEFNGAMTFPPEHGMDQRRFDTLIAGLHDRDVDGAQTSSGTAISADVIRDYGQFRAIGEGRYLVQLSNASAAVAGSLPYVTTANGQPFILDLTPQARHLRDVNG